MVPRQGSTGEDGGTEVSAEGPFGVGLEVSSGIGGGDATPVLGERHENCSGYSALDSEIRWTVASKE